MLLSSTGLDNFKSDSNFENLVSSVNTELIKLSSWYRANGLSVHPKKLKFIIFKPTNFQLPEEINININNNDPGETDSYKISKIQQISDTSEEKSVRVLGVLLNEKLKIRSHINSICSKSPGLSIV